MNTHMTDHLGPGQYSRLIYGAIIGLALTVALEHEEPDAAVMAGTLVGTGIAVGLAELYSEFLGAELRTRRRVDRARFREIATNVVAVIFGASFPAIFFALAAAGAMETGTAFEIAKWSGLPLTAFYGFCAARLRGEGWPGGALPGGRGRAHWRVSDRVEGAPSLSPGDRGSSPPNSTRVSRTAPMSRGC